MTDGGYGDPDSGAMAGARACTSCGAVLLPDDRYCQQCGEDSRPVEDVDAYWSGPLRRLREGLTGKYRVTRKLGQGGQAAVYLAEDLKLHRQVAIKVLAPGRFVTEKALERFEREARTIASLSHPNIVTIFSVGNHEDLHYFVMQFIEGRSLATVIADWGQLPLSAVRAVAHQVGSALQYAHDKKGVVHRDIKPANVLFDEEGNAILTDFGIAKHTTSNHRRLSEIAVGTPAYMSPEQCREKPVTWSSDQYSLGILIYEMLTGRVPFEGSRLDIMNGHTQRELPNIRQLRPDCPVELERAVRRMLEKEPNDRWPSMAEAMQGLGAAPLSRDDPVRHEIMRLALDDDTPNESSVTPTGPMRLELRVPGRLEMGDRVPLRAVCILGAGGNPQPIDAVWTVDDPDLAVVDGTPPVLIGKGAGRVRLTVTTTVGAASSDVEIFTPPIDKVAVSTPRATLEVGDTMQATLEAFDRRGNIIPAAAAWRSTAPAVVAVDDSGTLRGVSEGRARVVGSVGELTDERVVFVKSAVPASIVLSVPEQPLEVHQRLQVRAEVLDARGARIEGAHLQWTSSDLSVATVDSSGTVLGRKAGYTHITGRSIGATATVAVHVAAGDGTVAEDLVVPFEADASGAPPILGLGSTPSAPASDRPAWHWIAVAGFASLLLLILVWRFAGVGGEGPAVDEPASRPLAHTFFSPGATRQIENLGYAFDDNEVRQDFSSAPGSVGAIAEGRLVLPRPPHSFFPRAWTIPSRDFAGHFTFQLERGDGARYGGFAFRVGAGGESGAAGYFLFLRAGSRPAAGLSYFDGKRYADVIPRAETKSLRPGSNAVDVVVVGDRLYLHLNGERVAESPVLTQMAGQHFGLFSDRVSQYSFDDVVVVGLIRR